MQRLYRRRFLTLRFWSVLALLMAALAVALRMRHVGGALEGRDLVLLWAASWVPVAFLAVGAALLAWRWWGAVTRFEVDPSAARFRLFLWRPIGPRRIQGGLDDIGGWHFADSGQPAIRARLAMPPAELVFPLAYAMRLHPAWRAIAPGAAAAFERSRQAGDGS